MPSSHQIALLREVTDMRNRAFAREVEHPRLAELKADIRTAGVAVRNAFAGTDEEVQRAALSAEEKACMDLSAYADCIRIPRG